MRGLAVTVTVSSQTAVTHTSSYSAAVSASDNGQEKLRRLGGLVESYKEQAFEEFIWRNI